MLLKKQSNIYMELIIYILLFITIVIFLVIGFYPMAVTNNKSEKFSSLKNTECEFCCNMLHNRIDKHKCDVYGE